MSEETKRIEALEAEVVRLRAYVELLGKHIGVEELTEEERRARAQDQWFAEGEAWREGLRQGGTVKGGGR